MKALRTLYTLLFGVAVLLFFGLAYPHHLHYQEQYQLFLFDSSYVWDIMDRGAYHCCSADGGATLDAPFG